MTSHPYDDHTDRNAFKKERTYVQAYKLFTLYYPAKLRKYTVAAGWGCCCFFTTGKKGTLKNLERVQARKTAQNTGGFNINTTSAYSKGTLLFKYHSKYTGKIYRQRVFFLF